MLWDVYMHILIHGSDASNLCLCNRVGSRVIVVRKAMLIAKCIRVPLLCNWTLMLQLSLSTPATLYLRHLHKCAQH